MPISIPISMTTNLTEALLENRAGLSSQDATHEEQELHKNLASPNFNLPGCRSFRSPAAGPEISSEASPRR